MIGIGSGAAPLSGDVIKEVEALWPEGDRKLTVRPVPLLSSNFSSSPSPSHRAPAPILISPDRPVPISTTLANANNEQQGWGMTEATCSLLGWDPNVEGDASSVGELNANCHAKIMKDDGVTEVQQGERGEIWVQAPKCVYFLFLCWGRVWILGFGDHVLRKG